MVFWPHMDPPGWRDDGVNAVYKKNPQYQLDLLPDYPPAEPHPFTRDDPASCTKAEVNEGRIRAYDSIDPSKPTGVKGPRPPICAPCHVCGVMTGIRCGACQSAFTCSKEHQKIDWPLHKPNCARNKEINADAVVTFEEIRVSLLQFVHVHDLALTDCSDAGGRVLQSYEYIGKAVVSLQDP